MTDIEAAARAVLTNAPILILDELKITTGRTSVIIAHRLTTIKDSDLIILLENGRIAEQGNHEELMARNGKYAAMYKTQMGN